MNEFELSVERYRASFALKHYWASPDRKIYELERRLMDYCNPMSGFCYQESCPSCASVRH